MALQGSVQMGDQFDVVTNMCPLSLMEQQRNLYRVDFEPEQELRRRRKYLLLEAFKDVGQDLAYDGDHLVYTAHLINNQKELERPVEASLPGGKTEMVLIKLKWTAHQKAVLDKQSIMFFCTRFKAAMAAQKDRICIGSDYFDLVNVEQVPEHQCQLAPGLCSTVYTTQCGPVLNVDMMFKHIRTDTVWDNINQMRGRGGASEAAVSVAFEHKVVMPTYWDPKRSIIIDRLRFDLSPQSTFNHKGNLVSYADYVRNRYGIKNSDLDKPQPLLESVSRTKRDKDGNFQVTHFIPSLCHLTGQTEEMKQDRFRSRDLIRKTAVIPGERLTKIQQNLRAMINNPDFSNTMKPWGIRIEPKLLRLPARRLPTPAIRNGSGPFNVQEDSESWMIKGRWDMFQKATVFENWAVLCSTPSPQVRELIDNLMYLGTKDMGIPMKPPRIYDTKGDRRPQAYKQTLLSEVAAQQPTFLVVVVPSPSDEPYKSMKQLLGSKEVGIPSQFVAHTNLMKDQLTKATKIMVQMNCKGGGAPWTVDMKMVKPTMIIGLDVHHGGDLEHKGGSVAAFVATQNRECTRLYSRTFMVKARQQELEQMSPDAPGLKELTKLAIEGFTKANNTAPQSIIVYRDGGSEGELARINAYEVAQFQAAIKAAAVPCSLTFIVVLKKVRTRYFMINPQNDKEVSNPLPGTIVDRHITNNYLPEFFLCCQHVNQGSATATKYQMICDDSKLSADTLQMYTYCLSHMYFNWNGTIRVPAPVKYASTLAKLTGQTLRGKEVNAKLWERIHYL